MARSKLFAGSSSSDLFPIMAATAITGLASIALLALSHVVAEGLWRSAARELGMACLVAAVLNVTLEYINRRRHRESMKEINQALFRAVFLKDVPEAIEREISETLLKTKLYRDEHSATYVFSFLPPSGSARDKRRKVKIAITHSYELRNMTNADVKHQLAIVVGKNFEGPELPEMSLLEVDGEPVEISTLELFDFPHHKRFVHKLSVPAKGSVAIKANHLQFGGETGAEVLCCVIPSTSLRVTTHAHPDLEVEVISLHTNDAEKRSLADEQMFEWFLRSGVLPGQGMQLSWKPKAPFPAAPDPVLDSGSRM